jgi:hypothetical protein
VLRQQSEALNRKDVYERLFGRESEWVTAIRLLAQFYEDVARGFPLHAPLLRPSHLAIFATVLVLLYTLVGFVSFSAVFCFAE